MTPAVVVTETCHYCRKGRSPLDIIPLPGGGKLCRQCYERHKAGVLAMSGLRANGDGTFSTVAPPPPECSECHLSVEELTLRHGGGDLQMAVHYENGLYRIMCAACDASYVPKRRDLYGKTEYGFQKRLD
jgi:hypothetical protein